MPLKFTQSISSVICNLPMVNDVIASWSPTALKSIFYGILRPRYVPIQTTYPFSTCILIALEHIMVPHAVDKYESYMP